jgi:hypothetical protein
VHAFEAATLRELLDHLDRLNKLPAAPPLHETDRRVVERWAEEAAAGIASRRTGIKLVQQVESVLSNEVTSGLRIEYAKERIAAKLVVAEEREAGTYWKRRDASRRAKQPTHVDVDPAAWRRARALASKKGMTIGHFVGTLVKRAAERGVPEVDAYATTGHVFARVDVDKPTWDAFRGCCQDRGVTIARGVGLVVERAAG